MHNTYSEEEKFKSAMNYQLRYWDKYKNIALKRVDLCFYSVVNYPW